MQATAETAMQMGVIVIKVGDTNPRMAPAKLTEAIRTTTPVFHPLFNHTNHLGGVRLMSSPPIASPPTISQTSRVPVPASTGRLCHTKAREHTRARIGFPKANELPQQNLWGDSGDRKSTR